MPRGTFSDEERKKLLANPNVVDVNGNRITYTRDFKVDFVKAYSEGKPPRIIFQEAGFDPEMLGNKRIERASDRWRKSNNDGTMECGVGQVRVQKSRKRADARELDSRFIDLDSSRFSNEEMMCIIDRIQDDLDIIRNNLKNKSE